MVIAEKLGYSAKTWYLTKKYGKLMLTNYVFSAKGIRYEDQYTRIILR